MAKTTPLENIIEQTGEAPVATPATPKKTSRPTPQVQMVLGNPVQNANYLASLAMKDAEKEMFYLHKELVEEPKVRLSLAPMYRPYFGNVMTTALSGIPIYFPVDGRSHDVPESFARIIQARRRAVDDHIMRKNRMGDVQNNFETYAGELKF